MSGYDIALDLIAARIDRCRPGVVVVRQRVNHGIRPRAGNCRRFATVGENQFTQADIGFRRSDLEQRDIGAKRFSIFGDLGKLGI